jgi:hypothetical protein
MKRFLSLALSLTVVLSQFALGADKPKKGPKGGGQVRAVAAAPHAARGGQRPMAAQHQFKARPVAHASNFKQQAPRPVTAMQPKQRGRQNAGAFVKPAQAGKAPTNYSARQAISQRTAQANATAPIQRTVTANQLSYTDATRRYSRQRHDRSYWSSRYNNFILSDGGYYYQDGGYWYPAYGYDPSYNSYRYDRPIYSYNNLPPDEVVTDVQQALQDQGYYRGAVDGSLGPRTRSAIANFQRDHGLAVTAGIDEPTLATLGLT